MVLRASGLLGMVLLWCGPVSAQILLDGEWSARYHEDFAERIPGPELGDYLGLPINDAARLKAESWDASRLTLPEEQCRVHVSPYIYRGPLDLRIWSEKNPETQQVVAIRNFLGTYSQNRTIWMDGRPHPSKYAPHTFGGFITGQWEGDTLTTYTTHMKAGYIRRNGAPSSDQATMVTHYRRHGDLLEMTELVEDPTYLTEPWVVSRVWQLDPRNNTNPVPNPCNPEAEIPRLDGAGTVVPHYLPGKNTNIDDLTKWYSIPAAAILGGAETAYPEYRKKIKARFVQPEK